MMQAKSKFDGKVWRSQEHEEPVVGGPNRVSSHEMDAGSSINPPKMNEVSVPLPISSRTLCKVWEKRLWLKQAK